MFLFYWKHWNTSPALGFFVPLSSLFRDLSSLLLLSPPLGCVNPLLSISLITFPLLSLFVFFSYEFLFYVKRSCLLFFLFSHLLLPSLPSSFTYLLIYLCSLVFVMSNLIWTYLLASPFLTFKLSHGLSNFSLPVHFISYSLPMFFIHEPTIFLFCRFLSYFPPLLSLL